MTDLNYTDAYLQGLWWAILLFSTGANFMGLAMVFWALVWLVRESLFHWFWRMK